VALILLLVIILTGVPSWTTAVTGLLGPSRAGA
jgi:hypothetical protein